MATQAATLAGVNWARIERTSLDAAREIKDLGKLLEAGTDSDADFGRLCELLTQYGETGKATALLIANVDEGEENFEISSRKTTDD
jgi:hypothetical protein